MFDPVAGAPSGADLRHALTRLATLDGSGTSEAEHIDLLAELERLKSAVAAAQARVTDHLGAIRSVREAAAGVPAAQRCRGLGAEVALARRLSPHRGSRELGLARALVREMPHTLALLTAGEIGEWKATLLVRETAVLAVEHREAVDSELVDKLAAMGDREAAARARAIAYRLDPGSVIRRARGARSDRHVSLRPAPDTMTYLTAFLPVEQGVACLAALRQAADTARAEGEPRSRGQVMADALVGRITGRAEAFDIDVEIQLVMTDATLLGGDHAPADVVGHGPIPAFLARDLVRTAPDAWIRRLYTHPETHQLVAMESHRRRFEGLLRRFVVIRDQVCRTPWCDALIRHADHIDPFADGGPTSAVNGQGLCESCNYTRQATDWRSVPLPGERHQVLLTTPTGHTHLSTAPDPPAASPEQGVRDALCPPVGLLAVVGARA